MHPAGNCHAWESRARARDERQICDEHCTQAGLQPAVLMFLLCAHHVLVAQVDLLSAVEPKCINLAMVTPGTSEQEREMNAKYVISIARKLGCSIFLLWEDVVEVNSKMILVFVASLMLHTIHKSRDPSPADSP